MNMIEWGMKWHNVIRNVGAAETCTIKHMGGEINVAASKIEPESVVNPQGIRVKSSSHTFIFNTRDVEKVRFTRGVTITYKGETYHPVTKPGEDNEGFCDPEHLSKYVRANLVG